jgi:hypothetical protein
MALSLNDKLKALKTNHSTCVAVHDDTIITSSSNSSNSAITITIKSDINIPSHISVLDAHGNSSIIELDDKQLEFSSYLAIGASCVLIGAAGTGKTTCTKAGIAARLQYGSVLTITDSTHKYLKSGTPGIIVTCFTRRGTQNIGRQMSADIAANTITTHKVLEYQPVMYEYINEKGELKKKRVFEPKRNELNKLDDNIATVIIEESSMMPLDLFQKLEAALPKNYQLVLIGDLNQLPPVFGHAILGYKLLELPVIELTKVHRQALDSPIIKLAHRIISGKTLHALEFNSIAEKGKLQFIPYPQKTNSESALLETMKLFYAGYNSGAYNPDTDIILCPQTNDKGEKSNKRYNCTQINKYLASHIAKKESKLVYEIIAGFNKIYFAIGDKCLFDKRDCKIIDIIQNESYLGAEPQPANYALNYFGHIDSDINSIGKNSIDNNPSDLLDFDLDKLISLATNEDDGLMRQASHKITIQFDEDTGDTSIKPLEITTVGDLLRLELSYALTVHKAQGSEWPKVFLLLHNSHSAQINRELLYTAVTRAKTQLIIVCEKDTFVKGINTQAIKGQSLAEKAEFFKGKVIDNSEQK